MSSMKIIDTVAALVEAWGGTTALAEWADVPPSSVSNWKAQEAIPRGYHLSIYLEAKARGIPVSPKLFGYQKWPDGTGSKARPSARRGAFQPAA